MFCTYLFSLLLSFLLLTAFQYSSLVVTSCALFAYIYKLILASSNTYRRECYFIESDTIDEYSSGDKYYLKLRFQQFSIWHLGHFGNTLHNSFVIRVTISLQPLIVRPCIHLRIIRYEHIQQTN